MQFHLAHAYTRLMTYLKTKKMLVTIFTVVDVFGETDCSRDCNWQKSGRKRVHLFRILNFENVKIEFEMKSDSLLNIFENARAIQP